MSQVTEQSVRFQTALASIKLIQASAVLDLTEDDFDFLTSNKVWIATDRSRAGSDKTLQVGYANHFYRSAHKFEQLCHHRLRRQNVGYSNFSQPHSHLSVCVLLQYLVERRHVVTQLGKLD